MELTPWPREFFGKKAGEGCPQCASGRVDETEHGVRYYAGSVADAYLQRRGPTPGYSVVIFRGRHVGELHAMTTEELASFWAEVSTVAAAIDEVFAPVHLNFQVLGNQDPHVHAHILARFDPDPAPSLPLPPAAWNEGRSLSADEMSSQVRRLRAAAALQGAGSAPPRVVRARRTIAAAASAVFELIADPARQPEWDANDNLGSATPGQRVHGVGAVFATTLRSGSVRHNHVVEFVEGERIAWRPSEPGLDPPGHLWRWELTAVDDRTTLVTHTYDWTDLGDPGRLERARWTTSERLEASLERLAAIAER